MPSTKRCPHCGKLMQNVTLGEDHVLQCPRCKYCEPLPDIAEAAESSAA